MASFSQLSESSSTTKRAQSYQVSDDEVIEQLGNITSSLIDITSSNQNIIDRLESNEKQLRKLRKVVQSRNTANDVELVISQSKVRNMIPKDLKDCIVDSTEELSHAQRAMQFECLKKQQHACQTKSRKSFLNFIRSCTNRWLRDEKGSSKIYELEHYRNICSVLAIAMAEAFETEGFDAAIFNFRIFQYEIKECVKASKSRTRIKNRHKPCNDNDDSESIQTDLQSP